MSQSQPLSQRQLGLVERYASSATDVDAAIARSRFGTDRGGQAQTVAETLAEVDGAVREQVRVVEAELAQLGIWDG